MAEAPALPVVPPTDNARTRTDDEESLPTESEDLLDEGDIIGGRFVVVEKLQSGSFGQVFLAVDRAKDDLEVALKVEKPRPKGKRSFCAHEAIVLNRCQGQRHIPEMYAYNTVPPYPYIALQLMSATLTELRRSCPSKVIPRFSLGTTIRVAIQALTAVRELHSVGVVHRDIKPSNFMLGSTERTKGCVYLLDFGLSRFYRKKDGTMMVPREKPGFVGSTRYASPNAHEGKELGRGDDLTSLFYVIVEMRMGRLPWRNVGVRNVVGIMKKTTKVEQLCQNLPAGLVDMGNLIAPLKYEVEPQYPMMERCLRLIAEQNLIEEKGPFDWEENFVQVLREDQNTGKALVTGGGGGA